MNNLSNLKRVHMIGIGGVGMSGIAELMMNMSFTVTGSDITMNHAVKRLLNIGISVQLVTIRAILQMQTLLFIHQQ